MNQQEAIALCRVARACCPQQAFDQYTPDAWGELLGDLMFEDAKAGLLEVAKRQPFVAPAEIRAEVRRIRRQRLDAAPPLVPPDELDPDDEVAYRRWLANARRSAASGIPSMTSPAMEPPKRDMRAIEGTFRSVSDG